MSTTSQSRPMTSASGSGSESNPGLLHSMAETISGAAQTVKEIVTGYHSSDASLERSDQQFTKSADTYASDQSGGPSVREKLQQKVQNVTDTVKEKLGLSSQQQYDINQEQQDTRDIQRMDTDYDEIPHVQQSAAGSRADADAGTGSTTSQAQGSTQAGFGVRDKLHQAKETVKDTLHQAKETVKEKLHMTSEKDTHMSTRHKDKDQAPESAHFTDQAPKSAHQKLCTYVCGVELYESDPLAGFYDRAYHDNKAVWDLGRPQSSFVLFLSQQALSREGSVLEVGCGTGEHIIHMASVGHRRCVGIDISEKAIHEAKHKAQARGVGERVQFKRYDVRHLSELGSTFDIVIDVCFGHTIPVDMRQSYADQLRTVLNPGGRLYMFAYAGKQPRYAKDIYEIENKDEQIMQQDKQSTTTTTKSLADDTVIVPEGMTAQIVTSLFSEDKGWKVDHIVFSEMELANGSTWPAMILCATFVGPKHSPQVPVKARDSTGFLQGVPTATGEGVLKTKQ